jgi:type VI secretion system protein VasJ
MDLLSLGKEPISPDQPTGSDVRYDPEFDSLQAEIDKLFSPSAVDRTDWKTVSNISINILSTKSKDLLVACYLAVSQVHLNKVEGLAAGLTILRDMLNTYWDTLFPPKKRMRGRLGAVEFWIERTETALENIPPANSTEKMDEIKSVFSDLDSILKESLPDPPLLTPVERQIQRIFETVNSQPVNDAPDTQTASAVVPEEFPAKSVKKVESAVSEIKQTGAEREDISSEKEALKVAVNGLQKLRKAASYIFEENPENPISYRYRRVDAWAKVSALPPSENGKTNILPPLPYELQNLHDLRSNGKWELLLKSSEQNLSQFIFWFDLNRFAAEALINLGEIYVKPHKAVCEETAFFLYRIPGLESLAFSDGTPFADPETRQWIKSISLESGGNPAGQIQIVENDPSAENDDRMPEIIKQAMDLSQKMKIVEAVGLIHRELQNCRSKRASLLWRLALCQVILGSDKKNMALPHFEVILDDIESYKLETWDPDLAVKALFIVFTGYQSFAEKEYKTKASEALNRIAKINPVEAIRLGK